MMRLTIDELQERWMMLYYEMGVDELLITEKFNSKEERNFIVNGLTMEFVDDIVMCYDNNDIIINNVCVLMMFLRKHLTNIYLIPVDSGYVEQLEFGEHGVVLVKKAS
jgi:hypothetical protein